MRAASVVLLLLCCLVASGCSEKHVTEAPGSSISGEQGKPGTSLAYEHEISIVLPGEHLAARMEATRAACLDQRFGACILLGFDQDGGDTPNGSLRFRVLPAAVEPLTALAGEGGRFGSRQTRAEDLAAAVADTASQLDRLRLQRDKLLQLHARSDLSVADLLAITRELSSVEAALQGHERSAADQTRRLETNLLTLNFSSRDEASRFARLGEAFTDSADGVVDGIVNAIEVLAYGLPLLLLAFPVALLWRFFWRRVTRR